MSKKQAAIAFFFSVIVMVIITLGSTGAPMVAAQNADLQAQFFSRMATIQNVECAFDEEKRVALLRHPVRSAGLIRFATASGPGANRARMLRHVTTPPETWILLSGEQLDMITRDRTQRVDLGSQPVVRAFVSTFGQLLSGDAAGLARAYRLTFQTQDGRFTLRLAPLTGSTLSRLITEVTFSGLWSGGSAVPQLEEMTIAEASGDTSRTQFSRVRVNVHLTPSALTAWFAVPRQ